VTEYIAEYLHDSGPECKSRLTKTYAAEIIEFSFLTNKLRETLTAYQSNRSGDAHTALDVAYGLMTKAVNTMMAGFELALSGYYWEPPILFRNAVEGCATAWDVAQNENSFTLWQSSKPFKSADSISMLAKEDKLYGKIWGHLSNMNVHTTQLNSSPTAFLIDGQPTFQLFGFVPRGKEETRRFAIEFSIFAAFVCLQLTEIVFFAFASDPETLTKSDQDGFARNKVSERHRCFLESFERTCRAMKNDPNSFF
jgi:hypothetical protein